MNLMFGSRNPMDFDIKFNDHGIILNLSTLRENFIKLNMLIPPREIGYTYDREFDIKYANYILENDMAFSEFFLIIYNLYIGKDVYVMSADEDWTENIIESLLKLIQQRYGINAVLVESDEDYIYAQNHSTVSFSNGPALYNLDTDKNRFTGIMMYMMEKYGRFPWALEGFAGN